MNQSRVPLCLNSLSGLSLQLDLEFFKVVLGWKNIINLPSFRVTKGDERGWAMLSRELQKCYMVKEVYISGSGSGSGKYLVGIQREKASNVAIGEGSTLAQATTQALVAAYQGSYASREQMQELKHALAHKHNEQMSIPAFKQFHLHVAL